MFDRIMFEHGIFTAAVFGGIWRYCQMKDGVCRATIEHIAERIHVDRTTVMRHIGLLVDSGYLEDLTPLLRNKPHIYRDTGKVSMTIEIGAVVKSDSEAVRAVVKNDSTLSLKAT